MHLHNSHRMSLISLAGEVCKEAQSSVKFAIPLSNRTQVGDSIIYQCKRGYTRIHENADRIVCSDKSGRPSWEAVGNGLEDCQINYCNSSDLLIENARNRSFYFGKLPEGNVLNSLESTQFFEDAEINYRCDPNYHFEHSDGFSTKCIFPKNQIGFGHWEPLQSSCKSMHSLPI